MLVLFTLILVIIGVTRLMGDIISNVNDKTWPMQTYIWLTKPEIEHEDISVHEAMLKQGVDNFLGKMGWTFPDGSPLTFSNPLKVLKDQQFGILPKGSEVLICDQGSILELDQTKTHLQTRFSTSNPLDILIDDGSHLMRDQQIIFSRFFPLIKPGGVYIMEDVHSSRQIGYDVGGVEKNGEIMKNNWWTFLGNLENGQVKKRLHE
ncbi:hypothetical protein TL16_g12877 [Triparma laevis f. inornata]|uniref:Methyltransferase n=2 Tax=Triparma laevis TaxID=1534972 RepID=A0A9W7F6B1_9STRA|nr:hypothetical protein TL16_g12877 [Triparma laevis f. inornata]GMI04061.1 hypothetical protein TrLO_g15733 [Triparma laevis f. longispina]